MGSPCFAVFFRIALFVSLNSCFCFSSVGTGYVSGCSGVGPGSNRVKFFFRPKFLRMLVFSRFSLVFLIMLHVENAFHIVFYRSVSAKSVTAIFCEKLGNNAAKKPRWFNDDK